MTKKNIQDKLNDKVAQVKDVRLKKKDDKVTAAVPRITNENVAEHREEVLSGARKYIYPLQHSKHRIVVLTTSLFLAALLIFSITSVLLLYRFENTSGFTYQVTRVVPFPIARTGSTFVAYENYLFELNHYVHYYENQQQLSFDTEFGQDQLNEYKKRALDKVINDAYVKRIADEQGISVTDTEVDDQIRIARELNRLGGDEGVFEDILREYWNWSIDDFRRSLKSEILTQKVIRALDTETEQRAVEALGRVEAGEDFAVVAAEYSDDDITADAGGNFGEVSKSNRNVSQQTVDALFSLPQGENSGLTIVPYGTGYALSIIKNIETKGDTASGAHIIFQLKSIDEVLNDRKEQQPYRLYYNPVD